MNFEEALVYELETISGLTNRVFPQTTKEGTEPPFVVYTSSEGEEIMTLDGGTGIYELTAEINVVGKNYDEMKVYTKAVLDKATSFYGRKIGVDGPNILSLSYGEPVESFDESMEYHRSTVELRVKL
jgi:hypothetical protein